MYTAKVAGQTIDIGEIAISFRLKNPMFDSNNGMEWSATYPFKLPNTAHNRYVFGFPNRTSLRKTPAKDYDFEHHFDGFRLPGDTIRVSVVNETEIECYVKIGRSDFISKNKTKLLPDLAFSNEYYIEMDSDDPRYLWKVADKKYPEATFTIFPVSNIGLYKNSWHHVAWIDPDYTYYGTYQNMFYWKPGEFVHDEWHITPFPYLAAVIDQVFKESGYAIKENIFSSDQELASLCIFNCNIARFTQSDDNFYNINISDHLPKITVPELFINIRAPFGIDLYFDHSGKTIRLKTRKEIITSLDVVDISKNVSKSMIINVENLATGFRFALIAGDSDANFTEQVKSMSEYFGKPIIPYSFYADLPLSPPDGSLAYIYSEDCFYIYGFSEDLGVGWSFITRNHLNYESTLDPEIIIEGNIGILLNDVQQFSGKETPAFQWAVPIVDQPGNMGRTPLDLQSGYSDFGLQLIFARGDSKTTTNYDYKLGSSFNYVYFPHLINSSPNYSLRWDGDEQWAMYRPQGLYMQFWKEWLEWRKQTKSIEFTKAFTPFELFSLDFSKKHFALNTVMILDEITFTVTNHSIKPAKIKAWTA